MTTPESPRTVTITAEISLCVVPGCSSCCRRIHLQDDGSVLDLPRSIIVDLVETCGTCSTSLGATIPGERIMVVIDGRRRRALVLQ